MGVRAGGSVCLARPTEAERGSLFRVVSAVQKSLYRRMRGAASGKEDIVLVPCTRARCSVRARGCRRLADLPAVPRDALASSDEPPPPPPPLLLFQ